MKVGGKLYQMEIPAFSINPPIERHAELCHLDSHRFLICDFSGLLRVVNMLTGKVEREVSTHGVPHHYCTLLRSIRCNSERSLCAVASVDSPYAYVWNYETNELTSIFTQTTHAQTVRFSRCGTKLYIGTGMYILDPSGTSSAHVECWDISDTPKCEWTYRMPGTCLDRIAINFDDTEITCFSGLRCQTRSIAARIRIDNAPEVIEYIELPFARTDGALYAPPPHMHMEYVVVSGGGYIALLPDRGRPKWCRQFGRTMNSIFTWDEFDVLFSLSGHFIDIRSGDIVAEVSIPTDTIAALQSDRHLILLNKQSEVSYQTLPEHVLNELSKRCARGD